MKTNLKYLKSFKIFEEFVKSDINVVDFEEELKNLLNKINFKGKINFDKLKEEITSKKKITPEQRGLKNLLNDKDYKNFRSEITLFKNKYFDTL